MRSDLFVPLLLVIVAAAVLFLRALAAASRARRLGLAALACGVTGLVPALLLPGLRDQGRFDALAACGALVVVSAVASLGLAIGSVVRRGSDGGPIVSPVCAILLGAANLFCGSGALVMGSKMALPPGSAEPTAKGWRSEQYGFEVTVPSAEWQQESNPNVLASFRYPPLRVSALVSVGLPGEPRAAHETVMAFGRKVKADTPTTETVERSGTSPAGHPFWVYMGEAKSGTEPYFFGMSVTRVGSVSVVLMYEGQYQRRAEAVRAEERRQIRAQGETFLTSVK